MGMYSKASYSGAMGIMSKQTEWNGIISFLIQLKSGKDQETTEPQDTYFFNNFVPTSTTICVCKILEPRISGDSRKSDRRKLYGDRNPAEIGNRPTVGKFRKSSEGRNRKSDS